MEPRVVWTARTMCSACGKAVARRVPGNGVYDVPCQTCGTVTQASAVQLVLSASGPVVVAAPRTEGSGAAIPDAERRRSLLVGAVVLGVLLVLGAAVGFGAWGSMVDRAPEWYTVDQQLVVENATTGFRAHVVILDARDKEGNPIAAGELRDLPPVYLATAPSLVDNVTSLNWTSCDPRECRMHVALGSVLFHDDFEPGGSLTTAWDSATNESYRWDMFDDRWVATNGSGPFAPSRLGRMVALPGGDYGFSTGSAENMGSPFEDDFFAPKFEWYVDHDSSVVCEETFHCPPGWRYGFYRNDTAVDWAEGEVTYLDSGDGRVQTSGPYYISAPDVEFRLLDAEGATSFSRVMKGDACGTAQAHVRVSVDAEGVPHFVEVKCA